MGNLPGPTQGSASCQKFLPKENKSKGIQEGSKRPGVNPSFRHNSWFSLNQPPWCTHQQCLIPSTALWVFCTPHPTLGNFLLSSASSHPSLFSTCWNDSRAIYHSRGCFIISLGEKVADVFPWKVPTSSCSQTFQGKVSVLCLLLLNVMT